MAGQYQFLFMPIRIGQTIISNRIVFAAHLTKPVSFDDLNAVIRNVTGQKAA